MTGGADSVPPIDVLGAGKVPLWVDGSSVVAAECYRLSRSEDNGASWTGLGSIEGGGWRRRASVVPLLAQVLRARIHSFLPLADGTALVVAGGMVIRVRIPGCRSESVFKVERGSRPLNLCRTGEGDVVWGEYFLNLARSEAVRLFKSPDGGQGWSVVHTFAAGEICHVHRVEYDPYDGCILVCTGDRDRESGIWRTRDGFGSLELVVGGSQEARTVTLLPRPGALLYATDNPSGQNWIMALDRGTGAVERIQEIPGPSLHGCRVGRQVAFSTMVERDAHEVSLWLGDESGFRCVLEIPAVKVHRVWRELAGYPTIVLPEGPGGEDLFFMPRKTKRYSDRLCRLVAA